MTVDVLVAGGGPVGLAAAIEARLSGLSVMVVEPRVGIIDKACGEGMMPGTMAALARIGVHPNGHPVAGIRYSRGARSAEHRFTVGDGLGVRRTVLHAALLDRAAALGVPVMTGRVDALQQRAGGVRVHVAGGGRTRELDASWLLGCDGLHSTVARLSGLARPTRGRRRYGLRQHFELRPWSAFVEVFWGERVEAYATPIASDVVGVALLGPPRTDYRAAVLGIPELASRLVGVSPLSSLRGAGPMRQRTVARTRGRVLLVGDASGYVDAITGEGLRLGFAQARAAVSAIAGGSDAAAAEYERSWTRESRDFRVITTSVLALANSPLRAAVVPAAAALPGTFAAVVDRLAR